TEQGSYDEARRIVFGPEYAAAKTEIMGPISQFRSRLAARTSAEVAKAQAEARREFWLLLVMLGAVFLAAVASYALFRSRFAGPIRALLEAAREAARGRTDVRLKIARNDELGAVMHGFNEMM